MAEPIHHDRGKPSSLEALGPPGPHWRGAVEVLNTLPRGFARVIVVLVTIVALAGVVIVICLHATQLVPAGGLGAAALAVYRRGKRAFGLLRGAH